MSKDTWTKEKNWKLVYTRSEKQRRANQLRIDYPPVQDPLLSPIHGVADMHEKIKLLFVCSRNQWRSPTAEQVWRSDPRVLARSAGTSPNAKHTISAADVQWADVILVMEEKHKSRVKAEFTRLMSHKPVHVLDIPDEYKFMDAELVEILENSVASIIENYQP
jgi:predicted protein tyrosine phosphatase